MNADFIFHKGRNTSTTHFLAEQVTLRGRPEITCAVLVILILSLLPGHNHYDQVISGQRLKIPMNCDAPHRQTPGKGASGIILNILQGALLFLP